MKIDLNMGKGVCLSYTNKRISLLTPEENEYCLIDIARGLAYKGRFAGQTPYYYSIAEHSISVDSYYTAHNENPSKMIRLACLLHDASEAYMCDMPTPFKALMPDFKHFENQLQKAIFKQFGIQSWCIDIVKKYDKMALKSEFNEYKFIDNNFHFNSPDHAAEMFIKRFWDIVNFDK